MIKIEMAGSFGQKGFQSTALEGGHVVAIKRAIKFLADELGDAVIVDANLTKEGTAPPNAPLGRDR